MRSALRRFAPPALINARIRRHKEALKAEAGVPALAARFVSAQGAKVLAGPFAGLEYTNDLIPQTDDAVAKLVASYEDELHGILDAALSRTPRTFINVGTADGYYAVGVARRLDEIRVVGFELDRVLRRRCLALAAVNGVVDRIELLGRASPQRLLNQDLDHAFVLCDCEGYEYDLFTPDVVRALRTAETLVEIHDSPGSTRVLDSLAARFADTHSIRVVDSEQRDPSRFPTLDVFDESDRSIIVNERRAGPQSWLHAVPTLI